MHVFILTTHLFDMLCKDRVQAAAELGSLCLYMPPLSSWRSMRACGSLLYFVISRGEGACKLNWTRPAWLLHA